MFRKVLDNTKAGSLANKFRKKRFLYFLDIVEKMKKPVKVIDLGGTENFWEQMGIAGNNDFIITLLNLNIEETSYYNIKPLKGDVLELSPSDLAQHDVIFSNSLIEHIPSYIEQKKFAEMVLACNKPYYIQTPNFYFPFEPHFLFPCFQFFPYSLRKFLVMNFNMGWYRKCSSDEEANKLINSIRLLKRKELLEIFPECKLIKEKFIFITKSFILTRG